MKFVLKSSVLLASLCLFGCGSSDSDHSSTDSLSAYQGIWLAPAYGQGLHIHKDTLTAFDYTRDFCFKSDEINDLDIEEMEDAFILLGDQMEQRYGYGARHFHAPGVRFVKSENKPDACRSGYMPTVGEAGYQDDLSTDLAYFYQTFDELSFSMELNQVSWDTLYQEAEARLMSNTTDQQLITELIAMIQPLRDGHTTLGPEDNAIQFTNNPLLLHRLLQEYADQSGLNELTTQAEVEQAMAYAETQLALINEIIFEYAPDEQSITVAANQQLAWFQTNTIGYLLISSMEDFADLPEENSEEDSDNQQLIALEIALDQAIQDLRDTQGLIIDIRQNTGGDDFLSHVIASRFTDTERLAYQKYAGLREKQTDVRNVYFSPRGPTQYLKPIVLLTSETTSSAAEVFALMMSELPHVTLMEETSQGAFSDALDKQLPRGLPFALSNEFYLSATGEWYEGEGVPVDIAFPAFQQQERDEEEDRMLEAAFEVLMNL